MTSKLIVCALSLLLVGVKHPSQLNISLNGDDWDFRYSPNMPLHPTSLTGMNGWFFDFPQLDGVHYLTQQVSGSILGKSLITFTAQFVGDGVMLYNLNGNECGTYPSAHLFLEHAHDKLTNQDYRWWYFPQSFTLVNQTLTITAPLDSSNWSNVYGLIGNTRQAEYEDTLSHLGNIGLTFGGGCFYGHGVWANGNARFILTNFQIQ